MNPEIQALLTRKQTADSLSPEVRQKYAKSYNEVVADLAKYGLDHSLPAWDYEVNSEILWIVFQEMGNKYENKKPYIEWMCQRLIPEVDESFRIRDQGRFEKCIQTARREIRNV